MTDPLSLASGAFATVGIADVVFRSGKELFELSRRARNASASSARLLAELRVSASIVAETRGFLHDFESSPFAAEDGGGRERVSHIRTLLTLIGNEFDTLAKIIRSSQPRPGDGWFQLVTKRGRWAAEESNIVQSCERLHRLTTSLATATSIMGRQGDISIRRELQTTKYEVLKLATMAQRIEQRFEYLSIQSRSSPTDIEAIQFEAMSWNGGHSLDYHEEMQPIWAFDFLRDSDLLHTFDNSITLTAEASMFSQELETIALRELNNHTIELTSPPVNRDITMPLMLLKIELLALTKPESSAAFTFHSLPGEIMTVVEELLARHHAVSAARIRCKGSAAGIPRLKTHGIRRSRLLGRGRLPLAVSPSSICQTVAETRKSLTLPVFYMYLTRKTSCGVLEAKLWYRPMFDTTSSIEVVVVIAFELSFSPLRSLSAVAVLVSFVSRNGLIPSPTMWPQGPFGMVGPSWYWTDNQGVQQVRV